VKHFLMRRYDGMKFFKYIICLFSLFFSLFLRFSFLSLYLSILSVHVVLNLLTNLSFS
jgi:hypothetical protein